MSILLVEDEPYLLEILATFLEDAGLHVCQAVNAHDALELLQNSEYSFSVMVTDLGLGAGDDGLELALKARQYKQELLVVYETGSASRLLGRPLNDWETMFEKPYDVSKLVDTVSNLARQVRSPLGGSQGIPSAASEAVFH